MTDLSTASRLDLSSSLSNSSIGTSIIPAVAGSLIEVLFLACLLTDCCTYRTPKCRARTGRHVPAVSHDRPEFNTQSSTGKREAELQGQIDSLQNMINQIQAGQPALVLSAEEYDERHESSPPSYVS